MEEKKSEGQIAMQIVPPSVEHKTNGILQWVVILEGKPIAASPPIPLVLLPEYASKVITPGTPTTPMAPSPTLSLVR